MGTSDVFDPVRHSIIAAIFANILQPLRQTLNLQRWGQSYRSPVSVSAVGIRVEGAAKILCSTLSILSVINVAGR